MRIGSGDTAKLLRGKNTKGFRELLTNFILDKPRHNNALNSPIHAFRAGAILEEVMYRYMPEEYLSQVRVQSEEFDVLTSTLDFAKLDQGKVVHFIEMKAINFDDFIALNACADKLSFIKKKYKSYYNQTQEQLFVSKLRSCTLRFVIVYDAENDLENWNREFKENEMLDITITRDNKVIKKIKERAQFFQTIKNYLNS